VQAVIKSLLLAVGIVLIGAVALLIAGRLGWLAGAPPVDLGHQGVAHGQSRRTGIALDRAIERARRLGGRPDLHQARQPARLEPAEHALALDDPPDLLDRRSRRAHDQAAGPVRQPDEPGGEPLGVEAGPLGQRSGRRDQGAVLQGRQVAAGPAVDGHERGRGLAPSLGFPAREDLGEAVAVEVVAGAHVAGFGGAAGVVDA
jgi:hypothetical protein